MARDKDPFYRVMERAYIRDRDITHTGEAMMLACLTHTSGTSRKSENMKLVQKIMKDKNLEADKKPSK